MIHLTDKILTAFFEQIDQRVYGKEGYYGRYNNVRYFNNDDWLSYSVLNNLDILLFQAKPRALIKTATIIKQNPIPLIMTVRTRATPAYKRM